MIVRRLALLLLFATLPGLLLMPAWRLAGLGAGEDDVLYYLPARQVLHEAIDSGAAPWLNPWSGLGRPLLADPQSAFTYPATWLFVLLPPLEAYPLVLWLHYSLAIWGMYRLLRSLGLDRRSSVFGGLIFAFSGFMLAHRAHFTMQNAAAWTPIVLWRLRQYALQRHGTVGNVMRLALAAVAILMQCLAGHIQMVALTGLGSLVLLIVERQQAKQPEPPPALSRWVLAWVCGGALFAVQLVPSLRYLALCTRGDRGYLDFVENSWFPISLLTAIVPMLLGQRTPNLFDQPWWGPSHQVEQFAYLGLLPLVLAIAALRGWRRDPRRWPWVVLGIFALLLGLGVLGPVCPILYWLPGSNLFRCPARALLLLHVVAAVLASFTLHDLAARRSPARARLRATLQRWTRRPVRTALVFVGVPVALVALAIPILPEETAAAAAYAVRPWNPAVWIPLVLAIGSLWLLSIAARHWQRPAWLWLIVALTAIDLGVIGWSIDVPRGVEDATQLITPRGTEWVRRVRESGQRLWVVTARQGWTPGEYINPVDKVVANTNVLQHVHALTDYGPMQPRNMTLRFGLHSWGESWKAAELLADTGWMRAANVGWILLCEDEWPPPTDCTLVLRTPAGYRLYRNPTASGMAMMERADIPAAVRYDAVDATRFRLVVDTWPARPGAVGNPGEWPRVLIAQLALPGWQVRVNGAAVRWETVDDLYLGVRVPPGQCVQIDGVYTPPGLQTGMRITAITAGVLVISAALAAWWERRRS